MEPAGPRGNWVQGEGCLGESHGWAATLGRTRASVGRTPCPGALYASRVWTWGTPDRTLTLPPRPPGYATQKATPLRERAATGPLREPGQHSGSQGRPGPSPVPDSDGPLNPAPHRLGRPRAGESAPLTTIGPGRKPLRNPGPGMERGGAGVARREAGAHIRTRSGVPNRFLPPRLATGPDPLGSGSGTQIAARGRCMQPGRSQGNQLPGRWTGA